MCIRDSACHDGPERQQHAARHDQVQHAQREEYALAGDALKLAPHDEAEGDEKNLSLIHI